MRTSVISLFFWRSPATIPWLVVAIWVDAIDRPSFRALSHVSKEIYKVVPSFANCDATTSVIFKGDIIFIIAALEHAVPCFVGSRHHSVASMSMSKIVLPHETSTGTDTTVSQVSSSDFCEFAAVATAQPKYLSDFISTDIFDDDQSTEALSGDINISGHGSLQERLHCQVAIRALARSDRCAA